MLSLGLFCCKACSWLQPLSSSAPHREVREATGGRLSADVTKVNCEGWLCSEGMGDKGCKVQRSKLGSTEPGQSFRVHKNPTHLPVS